MGGHVGITVVTRLVAAKGRETDLQAVLCALCEQSLRPAPGCTEAEVSCSAHSDRHFLLLTRFVDARSHADHAASEAWADALPGLMDCLEGLPDIEIYQALSGA